MEEINQVLSRGIRVAFWAFNHHQENHLVNGIKYGILLNTVVEGHHIIEEAVLLPHAWLTHYTCHMWLVRTNSKDCLSVKTWF